MQTAEGESSLWLADQAAGVARLHKIKLGAAAGEWVEVVAGLNPADRLISGGREGLRDGQRITVVGEDTSGAGVQLPGAESKPGRLPPPAGGHKGKH